jgi:hypothetical protein
LLIIYRIYTINLFYISNVSEENTASLFYPVGGSTKFFRNIGNNYKKGIRASDKCARGRFLDLKKQNYDTCLLPVSYLILLALFLVTEDGGDIFLRNIG